MNKFGRTYELRVQATGGGPDVIIKPPFTIEFDVQRHTYSSATMSVLRIYNLSESTRNKLRKNQTDRGMRKKCEFRAGYGTELSTVVVGNVMQGFSVRESTNYVTTLEIFDGGFAYANALINTPTQFPENTAYRSAVVDLIKLLKDYDVSLGSVGTVNGVSGRGMSLVGPTIRNIKELTNSKFFIDNGTAHVLDKNEVIPAPLKILDSSSGLLGTPIREETFVQVELLFEPKILAGQKLELKSITEPKLACNLSLI